MIRLKPVFENRCHYPRTYKIYKSLCYYDFDVLNNDSGVYKINLSNGLFYIGRSKNIQKRIAEHIDKALDYYLYGTKKGYHTIAEKTYKPLSNHILNNQSIVIELLSSNPDDEKELIRKYDSDKIINTQLYKNYSLSE
jgi:excinuclease UvrABC nuclease subunit